MDPTASDQPDLDYLLGVSGATQGTLPVPAVSGVPSVPTISGVPVGAVLPSTEVVSGIANAEARGAPGSTFRLTAPTSGDDATGEASTNDGGGNSADVSTGTTPANPKKRPLEDKKARDRKRVLRNRQLARVSNERRKGRIKAMENELTETRQTVSTLEESIRCLEEENRELRNLLQGKPDGGTSGVPPSVPPPSVPPVVPPSV